MEQERVFECCTRKKASWDGRYYIVRLPREIVHFLEEKKIPVDELLIEGIWQIAERAYRVHLIFGDYKKKPTEYKETSKEEPDNEKDEVYNEDDYVVLR